MRLVTFQTGDRTQLGALDGDAVVNLAAVTAAAADHLRAAPAAAALGSMRALLVAGERGLDFARWALDRAGSAADPAWRLPAMAVTLQPPVPDPRKIFALAGNYAEHIREGGGVAPAKMGTVPQVFVKPVTTLVGHLAPIRLPGPICVQVDYEGELAVVIGRPCRNVSEAQALAHVAGYMNFDDVSGRALEVGIADRERTAHTGFFDWLNGKWFDTFGPCGPFLRTVEEVADPQSLHLETRVNGAVRQRASTGDMLFSVAETVAWISRFVTLEPGDIIATGTPSGVGSTSGRFLQASDVVEVEIEGLGTLRNPVAE